MRTYCVGVVYEASTAMTSTSDMSPKEALREQAIAWHVRLQSDAAQDSDWLDFEAWLGESAEHTAAYDAVEAVWLELDAIPLPPSVGNVSALRRRPRLPVAAWISALAACLVAAILVGLSFTDIATPTQTYETGAGQKQDIALADGSHVILNGKSKLSVRLGRRERRVTMADAEAVFDVAKDARRPFLIEAGDRQVRVVGTRFNVLHRDGEVAVTVQRGIVEVRDAADREARPLARLTPGHALSHRVGVSGDAISTVDPEAAMAWTEGRLIFRDAPLSEVVKVLNRYGQTPIIVADNARNLPLTAVLVIDRDEAMARRLCDFLPLQLERKGGELRLGRRAGS